MVRDTVTRIRDDVCRASEMEEERQLELLRKANRRAVLDQTEHHRWVLNGFWGRRSVPEVVGPKSCKVMPRAPQQSCAEFFSSSLCAPHISSYP